MSRIILFRGKAATGKSTLSSELGKAINVPVIRKDDIYDSIAPYVHDHGVRNRLCFDMLYRLLASVIESKANIIIDFGYNNAQDVENLRSWVEERDGNLTVMHCICSDEAVWAERLDRRSLDPRPNQLITNIDELKRHYLNFNTDPLPGELLLDGVEDKGVLIKKALAFLSVTFC